MKKFSILNSKFSIPSGFTLIELLVVISIVGILAVGLIATINPQTQLIKSRNSSRRSLLRQTADAIERYNIANGSYPSTNGNWCGPSRSYWSGPCGADWIPGLVASGEIKALPKDPGSFSYSSVCDINPANRHFLYNSNGTDYKLLAHCTPEGTLSPTDPLYDPTRATYSWAIYSPGAKNW